MNMQPVKTSDHTHGVRGIELPAIVRELNTMFDKGQFDADDISKVLQHDAKLCSRLLNIANSPMYSDGMTITTIVQIINYLGVIQVRELILLLGILAGIGQLLKNNNDVQQCWQQHVYCALLAYNLARQSRQVHPHTVYTGCMLLGIVELQNDAHPEYANSNLSSEQVVQQWGLPPILAECVLYSENLINRQFPEAVAHVYIASQLALLPADTTVNQDAVNGIEDAYWQAAGIDSNNLDTCIVQAKDMLANTVALLADG